MSDTDLTYTENNRTYNILPYENEEWKNHVERFGVTVPEQIIDKTMGISTCCSCGQKYAGYQEKCTKLRFGYRGNYYGTPEFGHKFKGEEFGSGYYRTNVIETKEYPCNGYTRWDKADIFSEQELLFTNLHYLIKNLTTDVSYKGLHLTQDHQEKLALLQRIEMLDNENKQLISAMKEIVERMNSAGANLMGFNV